VSARVVAVLVTWNRPELLVEALEALVSQSRPIDGLVVIDNASDAPVDDIVTRIAPDAHLIRLPTNTGGAGGFTLGIEEAVRVLAADFVWLMDDDTVPTATALEELLAVQAKAPANARLFGSSVVWTNGQDHPMNTPRVRPFASAASVAAARLHDAYPVRSISFVSVMIDSRAIVELGLPVADYFLWNDDFEYTSRILRRYTGYLCTRSVVVHKTKVFGSTDIDPGPRFAFEVRNKLWLLTRSSALSPAERVLYSGASLRTWARTIAKSADRKTLVVGLGRGIRQAVSGSPRDNASVLADADAGARAGITAIDRAAKQ
jgi:rhamnopyranosyl-N-acetylglucosaminyl-diphospho-decaprenol beta-1,3/1,4-galactofuranosyltransferase